MAFPADHKTVQFPRGSTVTNDGYTGPAGQVTVDTTLNRLRLHDGATAGGKAIYNATDVDALIASVTIAAGNDATALTGTDTTLRTWPATAFGQFAPKASPTFTGTPAAPTAAAATNTTQIATTAFVVDKLASILGTNAEALAGTDIIGKVWPATAFSQFAPKASPALTGTPTAPTPAVGDNSTKLATTAFVTAGFKPVPYSGSDPANVDFPIGTIIGITEDVNYQRNAVCVPRVNSANNLAYTFGVSGNSALSGTWAAKGRNYIDSTHILTLCERIA